jgi:hypothetical protein
MGTVARFPQMVPLAKIIYQSRSYRDNPEDNCERFESVRDREDRAHKPKRVERQEDSEDHGECEHDMHWEPQKNEPGPQYSTTDTANYSNVEVSNSESEAATNQRTKRDGNEVAHALRPNEKKLSHR